MNPLNTTRFLGLLLMLALFTGTTAQADCINGPKRSPRGWTEWETIYHRNGVDLQVRYKTKTFIAGTGREKTYVQFRYTNYFDASRTVELTNVQGVKIDGSAFFWERESYPMTPFGLPDESGVLEGRSYADSPVHLIDGRICKYTFDFRAY